ncbi:MAG: VOC family protein [Dysgonamonadaceae bacterium]|jgi:lactoylglutathione lyase|nr:VOC family protein [Dysgonamonadaceae bacterium]
MEIKAKFDHYNVNVLNMEKSLAFYEKALGLKIHHRQEASDGSFVIIFLTDSASSFLLELTWLRDWKTSYNLGDNEHHLCVRVAGDYEKIRQFHRENGWICFENHDMGLYFINDPDDYWIEILPVIEK